ncbi:MAG: TetR/AcrR family transcriptional regulator [Acidimicrobiales bacterium]|jgi:AcrR family transcriptional regulator
MNQIQDVPAGPVTTASRPGRPRSERARLAILEAAADLLIEGGLGAATIEAIAARAGVSKVTIYKWWPTRGAVAVDAYFHRAAPTNTIEDTGDVARDLTNQLAKMIDAFRGRPGVVMAELIGQAQTDPNLAEILRSRWLKPRRDEAAAALQRSIDRGEIRPDVDIPALMDQLFAPIYYRLIMQHEPLDEELAETLVCTLLDGVRRR